jgi:L-alanine-DL-glutamate epimerase-like enolase superfamily enzyme
MKIGFRRFDLKLAHTWTIARSLKSAAGTGADVARVVLVELTDADGTVGLGEAAPSSRYQENVDSVRAFLEHIDAGKLSFSDVPGSMKYVESIAPKQFAAKGAINIALLDGAARRAGKPVYDHLGLGFTENKHLTSFSIGIDKPEVIRRKVEEAGRYPILKLKVGSPDDKLNLGALREVAPTKTVRVDGNEAWKTKEEALKNIEWLASDGHVEFVEQPMPSSTPLEELAWLKERSPLPIMADESYHHASDIEAVAGWAHAVNVKLVKTAGISGAFDALKAARKAGLKTMIGCMIETSVLITAAAHLAELTDYLDIDGNLLITNDPYLGATAEKGVVSFAKTPEKIGLRVRARTA